MIVKQHWMTMVLIVCGSLAANDQDVFKKANAYYHDKEFSTALATYQTLPNKSPVVWYNMGNCAYHMQDYEKAHMYWSFAQRKASDRVLRDAILNSETIKDKVLAEQYASWTERIMVILQRFALSWSLLTLQALFLACWCCIWLLLLRARAAHRKTKLYSSVFLTALIGMLMISHYTFRFEKIGIVSKPTVTVFAGPNADYHILGTLNESDQIRIHELKNAWCKVECEQLIGWIPIDTLVVV